MKYESVEHTTCNENCREEVKLFHYQSFWRWLTNQPAKVEIYETSGRYIGNFNWFNKATGKRASDSKVMEIWDAIEFIKYHNNL